MNQFLYRFGTFLLIAVLGLEPVNASVMVRSIDQNSYHSTPQLQLFTNQAIMDQAITARFSRMLLNGRRSYELFRRFAASLLKTSSVSDPLAWASAYPTTHAHTSGEYYMSDLTPGSSARPPHRPTRANAALSFWTVDLKLSADGQVKILEFNPGMHSGFEGYAATHQNYRGAKEMLSLVWPWMAKLGLPIWYSPNTEGPGPLDAHHAADTLRKHKGWVGPMYTMEEAIRRGEFATPKPRPDFDPTNLSTYSGIWVAEETNRDSRDFIRVRENYPWILVLDEWESILPYLNDKFLTHTLFEPPFEGLRPGQILLPTLYSTDMASSIQRNMPADKYILKPLDAARGEGIFVVPKEDLDAVLQHILLIDKKAESKRLDDRFERLDLDNNPFHFWIQNKTPVFIVETYEPSKAVLLHGLPYDGTLRLAFAFMHSQGNTHVHFFDGYWKLPAEPLGRGNERQTHVSKIDPERMSAARVSKTDRLHAERQLAGVLPSLFDQILNTPRDRILDRLWDSGNPSAIAYGIYLTDQQNAFTSRKLDQFLALADEHNPLYDGVLASASASAHAWYRDPRFSRLLVTLSYSENSHAREEVLRIIHRQPKISESLNLALYLHQQRNDSILDTRLCAENVAFLVQYGKLNEQDLLQTFEALFISGDPETQQFILKDVLKRGLILRAAPILRQLIEGDNELFSYWLFLLQESLSTIDRNLWQTVGEAEALLQSQLAYLSDLSLLQSARLIIAVRDYRLITAKQYFVEKFYELALVDRDESIRDLADTLKRMFTPASLWGKNILGEFRKAEQLLVELLLKKGQLHPQKIIGQNSA